MKNWDGGGGIPLKVILAVWQSETKNEVISTFASFVPFLCACPGWVENSHLSCSEPGALWQVKQELSELVLDSWDQKRLVSGYFPIFSGLFLKKIAHWAATALQSGGKVSKPLAHLHLKTVLVCQGVRKHHGQHAPLGLINLPPLPSRSGSSLSKKAPQLASWRKPSWGLRKREPKEKFIVVQAIMKPMHRFFPKAHFSKTFCWHPHVNFWRKERAVCLPVPKPGPRVKYMERVLQQTHRSGKRDSVEFHRAQGALLCGISGGLFTDSLRQQMKRRHC